MQSNSQNWLLILLLVFFGVWFLVGFFLLSNWLYKLVLACILFWLQLLWDAQLIGDLKQS